MKNILTNENWPDFEKNEAIELSGILFTLRDGTLKKLFEEEEKPELLQNAIVYFCGPTPPPPGEIIGSCGPTTSGRMELYFEKMLDCGAKAFVGKGEITEKSKKILAEKGGIYFAAIGGVGALLNEKIESAKVIRFPELGPEAVYELHVKNFPVVAV